MLHSNISVPPPQSLPSPLQKLGFWLDVIFRKEYKMFLIKIMQAEKAVRFSVFAQATAQEFSFTFFFSLRHSGLPFISLAVRVSKFISVDKIIALRNTL